MKKLSKKQLEAFDNNAANIGMEIVILLNLKTIKGTPNLYKTTWGSKTLTGLGYSIRRIVTDKIRKK